MGHVMWWLAAALLLGIVEVGTVDFVFLMLALGALGASIVSAFGAGLTIEVVVFSLVAVLGLVLLRPWIKSRLARATPDAKTNVHALVGAQALVLSDTDAWDGRIKLAGEVWSARTEGPPLSAGTQVTVVTIAGATAIIEAADLTQAPDTSHDDSELPKGKSL